ncbi:MAG: nitrilase-related carbon-nitrogen hydrolase, partial [Candidatus Gallimonas sp.]
MEYGFIKARAVSPELRVADPFFNCEAIAKETERAARDGVQLLVFPELSLSGYTCGDLFLQDALLCGCLKALSSLVERSAGIRTLCFVGLPFVYGGRLYNCAAAYSDGKLLALVPKRNLPNYNEFYEKRHFTEGMRGVVYTEACGATVPFGTDVLFCDDNESAFCVACEICEDLWVPQSPSVAHALAGATVIVNLSASNELVGKSDYRRLLLQSQSAKLVCGYVYADAGIGESTTDMVFAGHNLIAENGVILRESAPFSGKCVDAEIDVRMLESERRRMNAFPTRGEGYAVVRFSTEVAPCTLTREVGRFPFVPEGAELTERCETILSMQAQALAARISRAKAKTAVIGISGGLDSALAFLVTARAFDLLEKDRKEIVAVTMPGFGTTSKTKNHSLGLMRSMGA